MTIQEDKLIELAEKAGFCTTKASNNIYVTDGLNFGTFITDELTKFAALVAAEATRWIPVGERLPEVGRNLIFYSTKDYWFTGYFDGNCFIDRSNDDKWYQSEVFKYRYIDLPEVA
jgi:hypothetical protein